MIHSPDISPIASHHANVVPAKAATAGGRADRRIDEASGRGFRSDDSSELHITSYLALHGIMHYTDVSLLDRAIFASISAMGVFALFAPLL